MRKHKEQPSKPRRTFEDFMRAVPHREFASMVNACPFTTKEKRELVDLFAELKK